MMLGRLEIGDPVSLEAYGRSVSFTSEFGVAGSDAAGQALVEGISGLRRGDVYPVHGERSGALRDGLYLLDEARVSPAGRRWKSSRRVLVDVDLTKVNSVEVDLIWSSVFRTNNLGVTAGTFPVWMGGPVGASEVLPGSDIGGNVWPVVGGSIGRRLAVVDGEGSMSFFPSLEGWFTGAATIEQWWRADRRWRPVPPGVSPAPGSRVRVSNGLVRLEARDDLLLVTGPRDFHRGWLPKPWQFRVLGSPTFEFVSVKRNDTDAVSIEVALDWGTSFSPTRWTMTLFRGQQLVEIDHRPVDAGSQLPIEIRPHAELAAPVGIGTDWDTLVADGFGASMHGLRDTGWRTWAMTGELWTVTGDGWGSLDTAAAADSTTFAIGTTPRLAPESGVAEFFTGTHFYQEVRA